MPSFSEIIGGVIALLLVVILGLSIWLYVDGNRITTLKTENAELTQANLQFKDKTEKQDLAIKGYIDTSNAIEAATQKALAQAKKNAANLDGAIAALTKAQPSSNVCKSADNLFNSYIAARKP